MKQPDVEGGKNGILNCSFGCGGFSDRNFEDNIIFRPIHELSVS